MQWLVTPQASVWRLTVQTWSVEPGFPLVPEGKEAQLSEPRAVSPRCLSHILLTSAGRRWLSCSVPGAVGE